MDVNSAFLYGTIKEEVYVTQPPGFKDPDHPDKVYKREDKSDIVYQEAKRRYLPCTGTQKEDGIFISQDKYVAEILKKFNYTNVKSMIGSLMYLTAPRPDIMFIVYACARFQVTPKTSHLLAIKRIFRYLKGKPTLGLWYSRDSPFELLAYNDSNYAGATQDRKSTTGGCQFLGNSTLDSKSIAGLWARHIEYLDTKIPQSSGPPKKVDDEAVHKELGDRMERAATTASSLEAEQDSGNNNRT
ncbi:putative ribonuclease H-like domain-containing protein [Tanacetum coccineum]|uniref:Ribonuclease H-like domain-containing protein n=1 Tax=Tanacetum coccineum TaxID=301880 RepID=A0ABQ5GPW2_9ASTR